MSSYTKKKLYSQFDWENVPRPVLFPRWRENRENPVLANLVMYGVEIGVFDDAESIPGIYFNLGPSVYLGKLYQLRQSRPLRYTMIMT